VILAAVTNDVLERALSEVIDQPAAKRIVAEEIVRIFDIPLTVVTQRKVAI
jgi:hypothetical protein